MRSTPRTPRRSALSAFASSNFSRPNYHQGRAPRHRWSPCGPELAGSKAVVRTLSRAGEFPPPTAPSASGWVAVIPTAKPAVARIARLRIRTALVRPARRCPRFPAGATPGYGSSARSLLAAAIAPKEAAATAANSRGSPAIVAAPRRWRWQSTPPTGMMAAFRPAPWRERIVRRGFLLRATARMTGKSPACLQEIVGRAIP